MKMKRFLATVVVIQTWMVLTAPASADMCEQIVADTEAELQAGARDRWNDDAAAFVRAAAGAACVKAQSGRYGRTDVAADVDGDGAAKAEASDAASKEADDWGFEPLSGSPAKKPFERRRDSNE